MSSVIRSLVVRVGADLGDFDKNMKRLSKDMEAAGKDMTKYITAPLAGIAVASTKMGMDFEAEMSKVVGLVGIAQEQVDAWGQDIIDMAPELAKAPKELAEGLFFITSAGIRGAEAMDALEISAKASAAGLGETKTIADALTSAMNAYGSENLSAAQAADILTAAVREGKLEASALAPELGALLPTASSLGIGFDQVAGSLAVMSRTGLGAAEAATSVNAIMSAMLKPSEGAKKALDDVGLSMADMRELAGKEPDGLVQVMRKLDGAFGDNEEALAQVIPNVRAFRGVMNVLAQDASIVDSIMQGVTNSTGAAEHGFQTAADTANFKWNQAIVAGQAAMLELWEVLKDAIVPIFEKVTDKIQDLTEWFGDLEDNQKKNIVVFAGIAAAIGPLLLVGAKLITTIRTLNAAFVLLSANPIMLTIAAATAALGGIAYLATTASKEVREAADKEIEAAQRIKEEGLKSLDILSKSKTESFEKEKKEAEALHQLKTETIRAEHNEKVLAEEKKTAATIENLKKQQASLDENHNNAINKIREEYGVFEEKTHNKTSLVQEHYAAQITAAQEAHKEVMWLLDEQLKRASAQIDRESSLIIGELEDKISLLEGATSEEVALEKKKRLEKRAIELEELIVAEQDADAKAALIQEREDIINQIVSESVDRNLELQKWGIREEILAEMEKAAERKSMLQTQYEEDKIAAETALADQVLLLEQKRDEEIRVIQEERIAKETAENAKYEATKASLDSQILAAESNLVEQKRIIQEGLDEALKNEAARHDPIMAHLNEEIAKIQEWATEMRKAMDLEEERRIQETEEKTKGFENTGLGGILERAGNATLWPGGPSFKDVGDFFKDTFGAEKGMRTMTIPVDGYASGTDFHPGGWSLVGEDGPEIARFPRGTEIIPNNELSRFGGDSVTEININANYHVTDRATAEFANNDLVRKIQGRGLAVGFR